MFERVCVYVCVSVRVGLPAWVRVVQQGNATNWRNHCVKYATCCVVRRLARFFWPLCVSQLCAHSFVFVLEID